MVAGRPAAAISAAERVPISVRVHGPHSACSAMPRRQKKRAHLTNCQVISPIGVCCGGVPPRRLSSVPDAHSDAHFHPRRQRQDQHVLETMLLGRGETESEGFSDTHDH